MFVNRFGGNYGVGGRIATDVCSLLPGSSAKAMPIATRTVSMPITSGCGQKAGQIALERAQDQFANIAWHTRRELDQHQ